MRILLFASKVKKIATRTETHRIVVERNSCTSRAHESRFNNRSVDNPRIRDGERRILELALDVFQGTPLASNL